MAGFKTKHSSYFIDGTNKRITGGYFGDAWVPYVHLQAMIGCNAIIKLFDGRVVTTGVVTGYF